MAAYSATNTVHLLAALLSQLDCHESGHPQPHCALLLGCLLSRFAATLAGDRHLDLATAAEICQRGELPCFSSLSQTSCFPC